jgi:hypothetical protein
MYFFQLLSTHLRSAAACDGGGGGGVNEGAETTGADLNKSIDVNSSKTIF